MLQITQARVMALHLGALVGVLGLSQVLWAKGFSSPRGVEFSDFVGSYQVISCELKVNDRLHEGDRLCELTRTIELLPLSPAPQGSYRLLYMGKEESLEAETLQQIRGRGDNFLERADFVADEHSAYWIRQYREFPVIYAIDEWREWVPQPEDNVLHFVRMSRELWGNDLKVVQYIYHIRRLP